MDCLGRLFLSTAALRLDAKGRVSVPAAFRDVLNRQTPGSLLCCTAFSPLAIEAGGEDFLSDLERTITEHAPPGPERTAFAAYVYGQSETLKMDREGRVVLTERLKTHAGISDRVIFAGRGRAFAIWQPDRFQAHMILMSERFHAAVPHSQPHGMTGLRE